MLFIWSRIYTSYSNISAQFDVMIEFRSMHTEKIDSIEYFLLFCVCVFTLEFFTNLFLFRVNHIIDFSSQLVSHIIRCDINHSKSQTCYIILFLMMMKTNHITFFCCILCFFYFQHKNNWNDENISRLKKRFLSNILLISIKQLHFPSLSLSLIYRMFVK